MTDDIVLSVEGLKQHYPIRVGGLLRGTLKPLKAVDGISFDIREGETLGVVGESGCGKSTLGRAALHLSKPTQGTVFWAGQPLDALSASQQREKRRDFQMVFQDPVSSLNPRMTVSDLIAEPLRSFHPEFSEREINRRVEEAITRVDLLPNMLSRFPHEFSGGQCQRISIARAIILQPKLLVLDEAVSALDVSVQAQIINLLKKLQGELGLAYLFISHDLSIVRYVCDRILVMYLGKVVESGSREDIFTNPRHPYTRALIDAIPDIDRRKVQADPVNLIAGELPSPIDPPAGCRLNTRCVFADDICRMEEPKLLGSSKGHLTACHKLEEVAKRWTSAG